MTAKRPPMSEAELQTNVTDTAETGGWLWWHDVDSRKNRRGLPDLILCHPQTGRLVWVELKSDTGKLRPDQRKWLRALVISHECYIWRPKDWTSGAIQRFLLAERTASPMPRRIAA